MEVANDYSRQEALERLNITPRTFRQMLEEYAEVLGPAPGDRIPAQLVEILATIQALRSRGIARDEIVAALASEPVRPEDDIRAKLDDIAAALVRAEERRLADHDRLLTALMRTQQELAHLRGELLLTRSRKDRRRRGLFGFGRR
jgi:hypothetical protein